MSEQIAITPGVWTVDSPVDSVHGYFEEGSDSHNMGHRGIIVVARDH